MPENEIVRHFTELADRNFGIDTGFYPLGSCTMKHNPRVNERVVALPGFRDLHPLQEEDGIQGALELSGSSRRSSPRSRGCRPSRSSRPPARRAKLTGLMIMRAAFADRGEPQRNVIVTADTAHGTNPRASRWPASSWRKWPRRTRHLIFDDLRAKVDERTAGLMLTNPSTLGLFDEGIEEVAAIFHLQGAPLLRRREPERGRRPLAPRRHGLRHRPLQPAQDLLAAARAAGQAAGRSPSAPTRAVPALADRRRRRRFRLDHDRPKSIGRVRLHRPVRVFVRSYAFMRAYGPASVKVAVLNANYVMARLRDVYDLPYDRHCMHEFVLSARKLKREHGVTALDVAKRLMDHGIHPPTIYFPLVVSEALMIEPTETETKERLDASTRCARSPARTAAIRRR